jgi:exopolysaccharide biosynthesis WecB/TagA/CpsF family protein
MYFFVTHRSVLASRIVLALFFSLSIVLGYLFRMALRHYYIKKWGVPGEAKAYEFNVSSGDMEAAISAVRDGDYDCVLIFPGGATETEVKEAIGKLEQEDVRTYESIESLGYKIRPGIISDIAGYATIPSFVRNGRHNTFGVGFCISRVEEAVRHVINHIDELRGEYVCFSNVHTTVMAKESEDYRNVLNSAALVFPDGAPIARLELIKGYSEVERVAGPDFMANMFRDTQDGSLSHFFYGSTQETVDKLKANLLKKYPGIDIRGFYSPPFRPLSPEEDAADVKMINDSGADIVWIGLGAPKQENWMNAHKGKINGVMMGVGAGFDFHGGTLKRAPGWVQSAGFEWLYRLFNDPVRLFSRYFVTNIKFFWYLILSGIKRENHE